MAHVVPIGARAFIEQGHMFKPGRPVAIDDEGLYHHLIRSRRARDPEKQFRPVTPKAIAGLRPGSVVTLCREGGLGDVLMVLVVMRALKNRYPKLGVRLATGKAYIPLLQGIDWLDGVVSLMDLKGRVDNVIDLRDLPERHPQRETMDRIDIFALACGAKVHDYTIPLASVTDEDRARARQFVGYGRRVMSVAVRGSTHVRTWPVANVRQFASMAAACGWTVVLIDAQTIDMPEHPGIRNLTGQLSLVDIKAILAESDVCVSTDSGLQHLAEAVGTKCLAIYSTIPPRLRIGQYRHVKAILRESLPCLPCHDRGCPAAPCMHVSPEKVMRAIEDWDDLGLATSVDKIADYSVPIEVACESEIMASWPAAV